MLKQGGSRVIGCPALVTTFRAQEGHSVARPHHLYSAKEGPGSQEYRTPPTSSMLELRRVTWMGNRAGYRTQLPPSTSMFYLQRAISQFQPTFSPNQTRGGRIVDVLCMFQQRLVFNNNADNFKP